MGPFSADTLFHAEKQTSYDVVLCMYHDQALIPVKTIDFYKTVNITLGLSFIRTSPDHGTAFERAVRFNSYPDSIINAIKTAQQMAVAKQKHRMTTIIDKIAALPPLRQLINKPIWRPESHLARISF